MDVDEKIKGLIERIHAGEFSHLAAELDGTNLGLYLPAYVDNDRVKPLPAGYSQIESNLKIALSKRDELEPLDAKPVAWLGDPDQDDSRCVHGGQQTCKHCTKHGVCRHCTKHMQEPGANFGLPGPGLDAPELDYGLVSDQVIRKKEILRNLSSEGVGLALLHGHNDQHEFTQLPNDYVAVISGGDTQFRSLEDVRNDPTFVPNMWRFVDGVLQPAGGYSAI